MKFFSFSYKNFWSCFFFIGIVAGVIAMGPIQLLFVKVINSSRSPLLSITKPGSILPRITEQDIGSGYFTEDNNDDSSSGFLDSVSAGRSTSHNFSNKKLIINDHLQQLEQHAAAILDGQKIIDANKEYDANNPVNPLDSLSRNYEAINKWPPITGEGTITYIHEYFENEAGYSIDSNGFIKQSGRDEWIVAFELINENGVEKIKIQLLEKKSGWISSWNEEISETLRIFFIDPENRPDILYYIKKILDPEGYRDSENGYHSSSATGFNALKNSLSVLTDYAVVSTSSNGGSGDNQENNPENFHKNKNLSCSSTAVCINYGSGPSNRKFASLEMVDNGKNAILKVVIRDIKWVEWYGWFWEPAYSDFYNKTYYFPVTTDREIVELQNRIQKQLNPDHAWTEPTAPDLSIEDSTPDNFIKLQNYFDTSSSFVWSWELTARGNDKEMKINNSRNSFASIYVNYDDNDINIRHTLAGIDGDQFQVPIDDFEASDSELIKLINLINERLIYNFVSLIAETEDDDGLLNKKIDFSIIYNFLESFLNFDDDASDGIYTIGPIDFNGYANPKFKINFLTVPLPEGESAPQIFDLLKTLASQIAIIPPDVWSGYFTFKESDTVDRIKAQLFVSLMQMISLTNENGDVVNEFAHIGTENDGDCDGTSCEIVNLTFQNQFHVSEVMTLISSFYKYLILGIGVEVSMNNDLTTIAENLFVSGNFAAIKTALQNLLADFVGIFVDQSDTFQSVIDSLFGFWTQIGVIISFGSVNEKFTSELQKIEISDKTIDSMLYYLKLFPSYSQGFYAIFSDEFPDSQKKKLIDFLNLFVAPDGSPLVPVVLQGFISNFAAAFFQWSDVPSNVNPIENYNSEFLQHLSLIVSAIGDEVFDYIEENPLSGEFNFSSLWIVQAEIQLKPYLKLATAEELGIVFFQWHDVRNNLYYTTGIRRTALTESKFEIIYHKNNQNNDLVNQFLNALVDAQYTIDSTTQSRDEIAS